MTGESRRLAAVQQPVIPTVARWIDATPGTISMGQGVVSYPPPAEALEAARAFGKTATEHRYGPVEGLTVLRDALREKVTRENGILVEPASRIVVTAGSNMGFINALLAIADPGDEIILPTPFYFNHEMAVVMANCTPVLVPTTATNQLDLDAIRKAFTPKTRAVVTVSPNNPTGAVYPESDLRTLNGWCRERGVFHISDEAYEYFTYGSARHFSPGSIEGAADHTISLFSFSKGYGMASWRVGYMVLPARLWDAVNKIQDTVLVCPPHISQQAALAAVKIGKPYAQPGVQALSRLRDIVRRELTRADVPCDTPAADGAFYFFVRVRASIDPLHLVERLVREHKVVVMPGVAFGATNGCYLRVSYGTLDERTAAEGLGRLTNGLRDIVGAAAQ